jgi:putative isomerase
MTSRFVAALCASAALAAAQSSAELSAYLKKSGVKQFVVRPPSGALKHEYLIPGGPFTQLFDWDMYFMGVALSYDGVGKPVASSVESFLEYVDENVNRTGYTPREIAPEGFWVLPEMCKPFLAQAALRASLTMGDFTWLLRENGASRETVYTKLTHTVRFWEETRRANDGLFRWFSGIESGVDNSPAVSENPADVTEGVDLQCYIYREYLALAALAKKLGRDDEAAEFRRKAADLRKLVQGKMWSDADGMFLNIDSRTGKFVHVREWTSFVPLWADIASDAQAERTIREHLLNPAEFRGPHGIRTLAAGEPLYDPAKGYWRGPVWVISSYLIMHGLMNYGHAKEAQAIAGEIVSLLVKDFAATGGMNECYSPETGQPAANGHFVSWDLLAEHMVEESEKGADPTSIPR